MRLIEVGSGPIKNGKGRDTRHNTSVRMKIMGVSCEVQTFCT